MNELPNGELELGPDGQTAWQFFSGLGLTDSDLEDKFKSASELDPSADPMEVLKMWAQESYPELLVALGLTGSGQEEPSAEMPPAAPAPVAPPAEPPVAEGSAHGYNVAKWYAKNGDQLKLTKWLRKEAGLPNDTDVYFDDADLVYGDKTIVPNALVNTKLTFNDLLTAVAQATGGQGKQNMGGVYREADIAEGKEGSMVQEVAKIVKSFYNRDNPEVGPFRGGEGITLDVKKQIAEKFGEEAGEQAAQMAEQFINKLTQEWQQRHGQVGNVEPTDGLARLKELLGNVKQKVESISPDKEDPPFDPDPPRDGERKDQFGNPIKHVAKHLAKQGMKQVQGGGGELARLKELLGNVKEKVESIGSQEEAYNPNSVDAQNRRDLEASHEKHLKDKAASGDQNAQARLDALAQKKERMRNDYNDRMERESVNKSQIPAYKRKEQGGDWKVSTKDLEKEKTNSPTSSAGLARKKAELGISEELAAIMKLSGMAK
jgi:hypothetical protein